MVAPLADHLILGEEGGVTGDPNSVVCEPTCNGRWSLEEDRMVGSFHPQLHSVCRQLIPTGAGAFGNGNRIHVTKTGQSRACSLNRLVNASLTVNWFTGLKVEGFGGSM